MLKFCKHLAAAFAACLVLVLLAQPAEATGGQYGAFTYELKGNGTAVITKYDWSQHLGSELYVPRSIDGYLVTEIGPMAFSGEKAGVYDNHYGFNAYTYYAGYHVDVVLPDTITVIADKAFYCTEITSCKIPASVRFIGAGAFAGCHNIHQFAVASGNTTYASIDGVLFDKTRKELVAFPLAYSLSEYVIPNGIRSIGDYAFYCPREAEGRWALQFAETVSRIGNYAFYNTDASFIFSESVAEIGEYAFAQSEIHIDYDGRTMQPQSIGAYAFSYCKVDTWDYPAMLTFAQTSHIGEGAFMYFQDNTRDEDLFDTLCQAKITHLAPYTFKGLRNLRYGHTAIALPAGLVEIGQEAFAYSRSLEMVVPANVTTIAAGAFRESEYFSLSFEPGSRLRTIGDEAFRYVDFRNSVIELPDGVEHVGSFAFFDYVYGSDSKLNKIVFPASILYIGDNAVNRSHIVLQVTAGSYADLWASENGYSTETDDTDWLLE